MQSIRSSQDSWGEVTRGGHSKSILIIEGVEFFWSDTFMIEAYGPFLWTLENGFLDQPDVSWEMKVDDVVSFVRH